MKYVSKSPSTKSYKLLTILRRCFTADPPPVKPARNARRGPGVVGQRCLPIVGNAGVTSLSRQWAGGGMLSGNRLYATILHHDSKELLVTGINTRTTRGGGGIRPLRFSPIFFEPVQIFR